MSAEEVREFKCGAQEVWFHPPDVFRVRFHGNVGPDEMEQIGKAFASGPPNFYAIVDTTDLGSITSAAKHGIRKVPLTAGLAIVGASRQMQLMLNLLNKVYMMVNFGKDNPITFVATEEEALRWVTDVRGHAQKKK